jgi:EAL domain-containing protein (putative c-di-GMP-specific phosphodiesterase class I)
MEVAAQDHRHLSVDLHNALGANQFFLVYQPTFDLASNALVGVEALLRWRHPVRGVVQPSEFIPALEASGQIIAVGAWVLDAACRQGVIWHAEGHRFSVAVNVAAPQLARDRIIDDVKGALDRSGFDPTMLILEMTETALMSDVEEAITRLKILKGFGVRLAVDDFGTGYSSLAYLREFPIDVLKIDRSFISEICASAESGALVQMLVQLGKSLDLEILAEGIESEVQRRWLQDQEVDTGQGFLFSRPLEAKSIDRLLDNLGMSYAVLKPKTAE